MEKIKTAVIFGGHSSEYGISLQSATSVINALDRRYVEPLLIGITEKGDWFLYKGDTSRIIEDRWQGEDCVPAMMSPNRSDRCLLAFENGGITRIRIDLAFPVLHGRNGEDGTVQGVFELAGIPVAGCGVLSSALCMDKDRAHRLVAPSGIRVPKGKVINIGYSESDVREFARGIGYPLYVKPVKAGSSYGISKVGAEDELIPAVDAAFGYDNEVIIEENIDGFEVGCAVLGNSELITGEVDEIELSHGFFDFTEKYTLKTSAIHVPARIDKSKSDEIKEKAKEIYRILGCRGFARVDMFVKKDGEVVFNEVNTIPGFTEHSRYPGMMKAAGHSFTEIVGRIVNLAFEK